MRAAGRTSTAPVLAVAVLGAVTLGGGSLLAEPNTVAGQAAAAQPGTQQQPGKQHSAEPRAADGSWLGPALAAARKPAEPAPRDQRPAEAPQQAAVPAEGPLPQQRPAPGRRPGTIVLAEGGTAQLVRSEVGRNGELPIPNGVREATWWGVGLGARSGATVFAGHVNWAGATGPFAELWSAARGDRVAIVDASGRTWPFRVQQVLTVHKNELPKRAVELFGPSGPHRAVLVTCGGRWVGGAEGYASNRIVVASPAS